MEAEEARPTGAMEKFLSAAIATGTTATAYCAMPEARSLNECHDTWTSFPTDGPMNCLS